MAGEKDEHIMCATYTHARRHPMVLGSIGGWTPPFQLTVAQIVVLVVSFLVEQQTWRWWGHMLPRLIAAPLVVAVPCLLAWVVRRTRIEGRSLARFALGWLAHAVAPSGGRVRGRSYRPAWPSAPFSHRIYVAAGDREQR